MTLSLELVPMSQDIFQSSDAWEGSSAGTEGQVTPPQPRARAQGTRRGARVREDLMLQHVSILCDMQQTLESSWTFRSKWWNHAWDQFMQQCDNVCCHVMHVGTPV